MHSKSHPFLWPRLSSRKSWSPNSHLASHPHVPSFLSPLSQYFLLLSPTIRSFISCVSVCSVASDSSRYYGLQPARLPCPWDSPGENTGVGCHSLLQWIFLTQESNPHILHWQADFLPISHLGSHIHFLSLPQSLFLLLHPPMLFPSPNYPCVKLTFSFSRLISQLPESFLD